MIFTFTETIVRKIEANSEEEALKIYEELIQGDSSLEVEWLSDEDIAEDNNG